MDVWIATSRLVETLDCVFMEHFDWDFLGDESLALSWTTTSTTTCLSIPSYSAIL